MGVALAERVIWKEADGRLLCTLDCESGAEGERLAVGIREGNRREEEIVRQGEKETGEQEEGDEERGKGGAAGHRRTTARLELSH